jgi:ParB-like chromosome segregation protein Spo0J
MNIETVKISTVKSNPNNPRVIKDDKFDKLVQSIKYFPQMLEIRPIVVNDDMIVLGGNMRLKACKEAGLKEVPIIKASDLTEEQQREFIIKDNVGFGEWDWEQLKEWDGEELEAWGLDVPTFMIDDSINDIDEVDEFTESVNFVIKCESIEQLEQLQTKLNTSSKKLAYDDFLLKAGL